MKVISLAVTSPQVSTSGCRCAILTIGPSSVLLAICLVRFAPLGHRNDSVKQSQSQSIFTVEQIFLTKQLDPTQLTIPKRQRNEALPAYQIKSCPWKAPAYLSQLCCSSLASSNNLHLDIELLRSHHIFTDCRDRFPPPLVSVSCYYCSIPCI